MKDLSFFQSFLASSGMWLFSAACTAFIYTGITLACDKNKKKKVIGLIMVALFLISLVLLVAFAIYTCTNRHK